MGAVATSVLNAGGRFAAAAIAPVVYNLAIIGGALILGPRFGVEGLAVGVVVGSLGHLLVQAPPARPAGVPLRRRASTLATRRRARRSLLMAPRAIGLGRDPDHVHRRHRARHACSATGPCRDFNFAFTLLQIPLGIIGVPLGIVVLPSLSRDAAVGHEAAFASPADPCPAPAHLRDGPDRRPDRGHPRSRWWTPVRRAAASGRPTSTLTAVTLVASSSGLAAHAHDRRPRPRLLRAPGHGHAGRRRGRRGRRQLHARGRAGRPLGLPGHRARHRHRGLARGRWSCSRSCTAGCRTSSCRGLARVGLEAVVGIVVAAVVAVAGRSARSAACWARSPAGSLAAGRGGRRAASCFGAVYAVVSLALRIPELPSIVGVMADLVRRPVRS